MKSLFLLILFMGLFADAQSFNYPPQGTGGGGSGTVTEVDTGAGLTGGPITTTGVISLSNTSVVPGSYVFANITVDQQGRLTAASSGAPVTNVTGTPPVVSSGGTTPAISMPAATSSVNGYLTSTDWTTFNNKQPAGSYITALTGDVTAAGPGSAAASVVRLRGTNVSSTAPTNNQVLTYNATNAQWQPTNPTSGGTVTSVTAGTGATGGTITTAGTIGVDVGTAANKIVQLTNGDQYPAVDGFLITNLNAVTLVATGTGLVSGNITTKGTLNIDVGITANKIVQLTNGAQYPAVDGFLITNLNAITALTGDVTASGHGSVSSTVTKIQGVGISTTSPTNAQLLTFNSTLGKWNPQTAATSGTVTSVAMTVPTFLSVSGSPITSSGTFAVTLSGTALPIANGGTSATTASQAFANLSPMTTAGDLIYEDVTPTPVRLPIGTVNQSLTASAGGLPVWALVSLSQGVTGTLPITSGGTGANNATTAFNNLSPLTTKGDILVYSSQNVREPVGANGTVLKADSTQSTGIRWAVSGAGNSFLTSGTTFTTAATVDANTQFKFTLVGGGGGGGGLNTNTAHAPGGGAGATCVVFLTGLAASTGYTTAIGAAGAGGISTTTAATAGGNTTISINATTYTAAGGGAAADTVTTNGGTGGACTNATISMTGQNGGPSGTASNVGISGAGGSGMYGPGGASINPGGNGLAATGFGGGGGGSAGTTATGGAGTQGMILVEWWN